MITSKYASASSTAKAVVPEDWWVWHVRNDGPDAIAWGTTEDVTFGTGTQIAVNAECGGYRVDADTTATAIYVVTDTDDNAVCHVVSDV